jgi:hypothetical protein
MMAVGTTLLCAACTRSAVIEYGPAIIVDAGAQTDAAPDGSPDAEK